MNFNNLIEPTGTMNRRAAFGQLGRTLGKAATVAVPLAAFLAPGRARAQSSGTSVTEVLNFALTLEYLEAEYYAMGLDSDGLLTGDMRETIALIGRHEQQHVEFLRSAISGAGGTPVEMPEFDFTAGGTFPNIFSDAPTFMAVAQAFEDTGVRAYKGQAGNLLGSGDVLTAALQIHSVEARHAAMVRRMRDSKGWITNAMNTTNAPAADAVYAGEGETTQLNIDMTQSSVGTDAVTEAFDEPLGMEAVLNIATLFIED